MGNPVKTESINYGVMPEYTGETPTKTATAQYTYTFAGWSPEIVSVVGEATYTAEFTSTVNKYVVKFVNEDGTLLQSSEVEYGQTPEYIGETPTKTATAQYTYTFNAWDKEVVSVTGEVTYTATFSSTVNEYTIIFLNYDGTELQSSKVKYGELPVYALATPTKPSTAEDTFKFAGWDKVIASVTGDATYIATFSSEANSYDVLWVSTDKNGNEYTYTTTVVVNGTTITLPEQPTREGYTFAGWDSVPETMPAKDITIKAIWIANKYTITFLNDDQNKLADGSYDYDIVPSKPADPSKEQTEQYTYVFAGWKDSSGNVYLEELPVVKGEATYTATYTPVERKYTINWVNGTELLESDLEVLYSAEHKYDGETPTLASTAQFSYEFSKWNKALDSENSVITYTAEFASTLRSYTITWVDGDGKTIKTETLNYGETPVYSGVTPTKTATVEYSYAFAGWDNEPSAVVGA